MRRNDSSRPRTEFLALASAGAVAVLVFYLVPLALMVAGSTRANAELGYRGPFVGLQNFSAAWYEPLYWQAVVSSVAFTVPSVLLQTSVALGAVLLTRGSFRGARVLRLLLFIPYLLPTAVVVVAWRFFTDPFVGLLTGILRIADLPPLDLRGPDAALIAMVIVATYEAFPFAYVILLARISQTPVSLYEVTTLTGAGRWTLFRAVTWPHMRGTLIALLVLRLLITFMKFDVPWLVYASQAPSQWGDTLAVSVYRTAFEYIQHGKALAASLSFLFVSWGCYVFVNLMASSGRNQRVDA